MKGLIIKSPYIEKILQGEKTWEIRGTNTNIRGRIALIKSGSGTVLGTVELVASRKLTLHEYQTSEEFHCISREDCFNPRYKNIYAWVLRNPVTFSAPRPYKHPQGAVIWVNL
ncbi:ASCH domain-containing protein [Bacillus bingmayongensis]|uniref:ASCH domain-containing protein n=1 Tax=Bacillus bingmayongensis TaxID=1150157 RepID=UPI0002E81C10|nr:ASCH domain-containing protein [Bacillus bingmayongensis]